MLVGAGPLLLGQRIAKVHHGRDKLATAGRADRLSHHRFLRTIAGAPPARVPPYPLSGVQLVTAQAAHELSVAVQLRHEGRVDARLAMEVVGVLSDEELKLAELLKLDEGQVGALGCTWFGETRHCGGGKPASRRVHTPLGPRKSGMPESVLMPAPVKATMCLL